MDRIQDVLLLIRARLLQALDKLVGGLSSLIALVADARRVASSRSWRIFASNATTLAKFASFSASTSDRKKMSFFWATSLTVFGLSYVSFAKASASSALFLVLVKLASSVLTTSIGFVAFLLSFSSWPDSLQPLSSNAFDCFADSSSRTLSSLDSASAAVARFRASFRQTFMSLESFSKSIAHF